MKPLKVKLKVSYRCKQEVLCLQLVANRDLLKFVCFSSAILNERNEDLTTVDSEIEGERVVFD